MFHFLPILERNLNFKCLVLLHLLNNMFKIHGFRNPSPKFHGFHAQFLYYCPFLLPYFLTAYLELKFKVQIFTT